MTTDKTILKGLHEQGYFLIREVPLRGLCGLIPMLFTVGLFYGIDSEGNYKGRYCYKSVSEASAALLSWNGDGDPDFDWIKHKGGEEGDRSNPKLNDKREFL